MKRTLTALALLCTVLAGVPAAADPVIRHTKICTQPAGADPTKISCPDWNADHVVDPVALAATMDIQIVSANPNGVKTGPGLALDTTNNQLWINTGGTTWTAVVRTDNGAASPQTAWATLGDSNNINEGVTTDQAVKWNNLVSNGSPVPITSVVLDATYANASTEPLTMVDMGTGTLRVANVSTLPGYGYEMSFGKALFDTSNGVGAVVTPQNKPWIIKFGISGVELKQMLPGSSYGTSTPTFGGLNAYTYWRNRTLQLLAASGRKLGGIVITLGGNDGVNSPDANAVAANMVTLASQIRTDFGSQVSIVWVKLHTSSNVAFASTVRSQMVTGASQISNCKLIVIDTYPINISDFLHFGADPVWDMGLQAAEAMRLLKGLGARAVTAPTLVGYGTPAYNNAGGALTPRGYPGCIHGDLEATFVAAMKNSGGATASSGWTASGWTLAASGAQAIGGQTQEFALFTRPLTDADLSGNNGLPPTMSVTTGNDENYAVRICIRGAGLFPTVDGSITSYAATTFSTSSVNAGGVTTTSANDLVVTFVAGQGGGSSLTENITASNATTGAAVLIQAPLVQNTTNYGLLAVVTGTKATAGATGTTVITPNLNTNPSGFTVAFH